MRQRSVSSIAIVLVGLVTAIVGEWMFVIAFGALFLLAYTELATMLTLDSRSFRILGYGLITLACLVAYMSSENAGLPVLAAALVILPLTVSIFTRDTPVLDLWSRTLACSLYVAMPAYAAVSIRQLEGEAAGWLTKISSLLTPGTSGSSRGLGWFLFVMIIIWLADTGAFLVGKSIGRRPLIPRISPNKTVEGAIGGLGAAAVAALGCSSAFQLDLRPSVAVLMGIALGAVGMLGDLAESMIKRQVGVKDSGTLIPGHGGVLDRIDALMFALVAAWMLIPVVS